MSELYIVATPLGNLGDITYRAVEILKSADVIACEDTRQTRKLLNAYGVEAPRLISCRSANERNSADGIVQLLERGDKIAYVSDAGTPGISDPGSILVRTVRDAGFPVVPVPGVSAAAALLSVCGFPGKGYRFEGFLSPKSGKRKKRLQELLDSGDIFVLYESPFRIIKLLELLLECDSERKCLLGREMTKKFEEYLEGEPEILLASLQNRTTIKGEMTIIVAGKKKK